VNHDFARKPEVLIAVTADGYGHLEGISIVFFFCKFVIRGGSVHMMLLAEAAEMPRLFEDAAGLGWRES
jgi:hypothetical protein